MSHLTDSSASSFEINRRPGAVAVTVHGSLDLLGSTRLGALLDDLIEGQGNLRVSVDLGDVHHLDPAGLGVFAVAASIARRRGGRLELFGHSGEELPTADTVSAPAHLVEFYESDAALSRSVCGFLKPALEAGAPVVVVATKHHRTLFEAGLDVTGARARGRYLDVDAEETLAQLMVGGRPDPRRFDAAIGGLLRRAGTGGTPQVYGEMVAVLWAEGNVAAAMAVEDLWNRLGRSHRFALLCAYPSASFDAGAPPGSLRAVCERHQH